MIGVNDLCIPTAQGWRPLAVLAYPAAAMKCAESWAFGIMTLAASLLPEPCTATAAVGVSYNVYGVLFIGFVACSTAACVTVGNRLGAGKWPSSRPPLHCNRRFSYPLPPPHHPSAPSPSRITNITPCALPIQAVESLHPASTLQACKLD